MNELTLYGYERGTPVGFRVGGTRASVRPRSQRSRSASQNLNTEHHHRALGIKRVAHQHLLLREREGRAVYQRWGGLCSISFSARAAVGGTGAFLPRTGGRYQGVYDEGRPV